MLAAIRFHETVLVRRLKRLPLGPILTIVCFPLLLLWRPLFAGESFFWGTPLLQFVPWHGLVAEMWRAGHLPLWNSMVGCGTPLMANYQSAAFYPLNALILILPADTALTWTTLLHVMLAGWGAYRWIRCAGFDELPACIGSLAFAGSGFLVSRLALFPSMAFTFPWVAVWLWRADALVRQGTVRNVLWLGASLGMGLLAGHAQTAFYGGLLLVAYLAFRIGQNLRHTGGGPLVAAVARWAGLAALAGGVGLGLAAVQLLPTAEFMMNSQRSSGVDPTIALTYSMWPWRLLTVLAPNLFGNPRHGDYWGYATSWEDAVYLGVLPVLLAMSAVFVRGGPIRGARSDLRSMIVFWIAVCIVGVVFALGSNTPVFPFLYRHVPGFDWFQAPARWLLVAAAGLSMLAAVGMQLWPAGRQGQQRAILWAIIGVALTVGGISAPLLVTGIRDTFSAATTWLGGLMAISGVVVALRSIFASRRAGANPPWDIAVVLVVMADLLVFGWPLIPTVDRSLYRGPTEAGALLSASPDAVRTYWPRDPSYRDREFDAHERVKFSYLSFTDFGPRDVEHWRGIREILLPNAGMIENVASVNNYEPMQVAQYHDLMRLIAGQPGLLRITGATHVISDENWPGGTAIWGGSGVTVYRIENPLGRAWVVPRARYVAADKVLSALAESGFDPAREVLLDTTAGVQPAGDAAEYTLVLRDAPNRVTIHAVLTAPGYLVVADTWYPGWRATVGGRRVDLLRANHTFRAIWLDAGDHTVDMIYRPASVVWGMAITAATTLGLVIAAVLLSRSRH